LLIQDLEWKGEFPDFELWGSDEEVRLKGDRRGWRDAAWGNICLKVVRVIDREMAVPRLVYAVEWSGTAKAFVRCGGSERR